LGKDSFDTQAVARTGQPRFSKSSPTARKGEASRCSTTSSGYWNPVRTFSTHSLLRPCDAESCGMSHRLRVQSPHPLYLKRSSSKALRLDRLIDAKTSEEKWSDQRQPADYGAFDTHLSDGVEQSCSTETTKRRPTRKMLHRRGTTVILSPDNGTTSGQRGILSIVVVEDSIRRRPLS
jgi:hypothetical protein